jgi:hypothetical protein
MHRRINKSFLNGYLLFRKNLWDNIRILIAIFNRGVWMSFFRYKDFLLFDLETFIF